MRPPPRREYTTKEAEFTKGLYQVYLQTDWPNFYREIIKFRKGPGEYGFCKITNDSLNFADIWTSSRSYWYKYSLGEIIRQYNDADKSASLHEFSTFLVLFTISKIVAGVITDDELLEAVSCDNEFIQSRLINGLTHYKDYIVDSSYSLPVGGNTLDYFEVKVDYSPSRLYAGRSYKRTIIEKIKELAPLSATVIYGFN